MGKKVYFLDSVEKSDGSYDNTYGVDDVNAIVSNLVGAGVAPFPSGDTYDVSELNSLTNALVAEGSSLDGLKVSLAENKIHIAPGIGYFENGATIVVDTDGEELDYNVAETLYVYAEYNQALNTCGFYTSESEPVSSTGIYVLILATIAAEGVVTDKRIFARSKIATLGRNVSDVLLSLTKSQKYAAGNVLVNSDIDISRFNFFVFSGVYDTGPTGAPKKERPLYYKIPVEDLQNNIFVEIGQINVLLNGNNITVYMSPSASSQTFYDGTEIYLC